MTISRYPHQTIADISAELAALRAELAKANEQNQRLREALALVMEHYVGERGSHNVVGDAGKAADKARAALKGAA